MSSGDLRRAWKSLGSLAALGWQDAGGCLKLAAGKCLNLKLSQRRRMIAPVENGRLRDAQSPRRGRLRAEMANDVRSQHGRIITPTPRNCNNGYCWIAIDRRYNLY